MIMCSLESGYAFEGYYFWHLKGVLTWMHKNSGQDWLKILSLEKLQLWGTTTHRDPPS